MSYTNSSYVEYTRLSPNNSGTRTHSIDRITPHCVVGQCSVEALGALFADSKRQASSNYGIGFDGRVGMYVPESKRSWCSSSQPNDQRAVTIECASDATAPYAFKAVVYNKLIDLCVDICKRNDKSKLLWLGDKTKTLNYNPASDEMVLTVHRWFANKSCPGDWMYSRMGDLAEQVTKKLKNNNIIIQPTPSPSNNKTCSITLPILKKGSYGKSVKSLQTLLIAQGYSCGSYGADGDFGNSTLNAVKKFQAAKKLIVDGEVGPQVWTELLKF